MPTKVTMAGGAPWGFRLSGGGTQPLTVSRLTPGGKAALDGILTGDHVIEINGQSVAGLQLGELMELIKNTGDILNLTTISESEFQAVEQNERTEASLKANLHEEHTEGLTPLDEPKLIVHEKIVEVSDCGGMCPPDEAAPIEICAGPEPIEEECSAPPHHGGEEEQEHMTKKEWYALPQYIRKQVRPPKPQPEFKPQVNWLHGKLRLNKDHDTNAGVNVAGGQLRNAVLAQHGPIEISAGPINGKIQHSQYNTPLNIYSDPQIISTLMSQAVASGADIQDPSFFMNTGVKVDKDSKCYKQVHNASGNYDSSKQSRSFNILSTLMKHPYEQIS